MSENKFIYGDSNRTKPSQLSVEKELQDFRNVRLAEDGEEVEDYEEDEYEDEFTSGSPIEFRHESSKKYNSQPSVRLLSSSRESDRNMTNTRRVNENVTSPLNYPQYQLNENVNGFEDDTSRVYNMSRVSEHDGDVDDQLHDASQGSKSHMPTDQNEIFEENYATRSRQHIENYDNNINHDNGEINDNGVNGENGENSHHETNDNENDNENDNDNENNNDNNDEVSGDNNFDNQDGGADNDNNENENEPIYIMTIELEKNRTELINIYADSVAEELAFDFCKRNNLDHNALTYLTAEINKLIVKYSIKISKEVINAQIKESIAELDEEDLGSEMRMNTDSYNENYENVNSRNSEKVFMTKNKSSIQTPSPEQRIKTQDLIEEEDNYQYNSQRIDQNDYDTLVEDNTRSIGKRSELEGEEYLGTDHIQVNQKKIDGYSLARASSQKVMQHSIKSSNQSNHKSPQQQLTHKSLQQQGYQDYRSNIIELTNENQNQDYTNENLENQDNDQDQDNEVDNKEYTDNDIEDNQNHNQDEDEDNQNQQENDQNQDQNQDQDNDQNQDQDQDQDHDNDQDNQQEIEQEQGQNTGNSQKLFSYQLFNDNNTGRNNNNADKVNTSAYNHNQRVQQNNKGNNIFDKLYKDAEIRRMRPKKNNELYSDAYIPKPSMMHGHGNYKTENSKMNNGERIYHEGMKLKEQRCQRIAQLKSVEEMKNNEICTFRPICHQMRNNPNNNYGNENSYPMKETPNYKNYKEYKENMRMKLKEKYDETEEFSHKPEINRNSARMVKYMSEGSLEINSKNYEDGEPNYFQREGEQEPRHEKLYKMAKIKELKNNALYNKHYSNLDFKPKVNKYNMPYNFQQRQFIYKNKQLEKIQEIEETRNNPIDQLSGQRLFTPRLISRKSTERVNKEEHGNYMFSYANKFFSHRNAKSNVIDQEIKQVAQQVFTNDNSYNLLVKLKETSFRQIFKVLDSDKDDLISAFSLNKKDLPNNINKILNPIFNEIKEDNETLNGLEFVKALNHLFEMLTYDEKHILLNYGRKYNHTGETELPFKFKPTIDKNSRIMANKKIYGTLNTNYSTNTINMSTIGTDRDMVKEKDRDRDRDRENFCRNQYSINNLITSSNNNSTIEGKLKLVKKDIHNYTFNNFVKWNKSVN